jgi:hypothetical protein
MGRNSYVIYHDETKNLKHLTGVNENWFVQYAIEGRPANQLFIATG